MQSKIIYLESPKIATMGPFNFFSTKPKKITLQDLDLSFDFNEADILLPEALVLFLNTKEVSTSLLQRKLKLGYNQAGRIMDHLEAMGIVSPFDESNPRRLILEDITTIKERVTQYRKHLINQADKQNEIKEQVEKENNRYKATIELEMARHDLFNLIGEPSKIEESVSTKKKIEKCYYGQYINRNNTTSYSRMIKLENDKVVGWKDL